MKKTLIIYLFIFSFINSIAQNPGNKYDIVLNSGSYKLPIKTSIEVPLSSSEENQYLFVQFYRLLTKEEHELLKQLEIKILEYIPNYSYYISIPTSTIPLLISKINLRHIDFIPSSFKIDTLLFKKQLPTFIIQEEGKIDIVVSYFQDASLNEIKNHISSLGGLIIQERPSRHLEIRIAKEKISELALYPSISYISPIHLPIQPLNFSGITDHRTNVLNSSLVNERNLKGKDIVIGIGDAGNVANHVDLQHRIMNNFPPPEKDHTTHVAGIIAGAGNINQNIAGMAPEVKVIAEYFNHVVWKAPNLYTNYGMVLTNNSYGYPSYPDGDEYDSESYTLDQQINSNAYPSLLHIIAAGNAGPLFYSIYAGYQVAKNSLVVGNITKEDINHESSGKGPTRDGRIKPEIVAVGDQVISTMPFNSYAEKTGTSMASPGVTGTLALLYERYKQLNKNTNPTSELIKAIICNTAEDLGNKGPDYTYGFGRINGLRSVKTIEEKEYFQNNINAGDSILHTITVPTGTSQLKVLLYWEDKEASQGAAITIVNDLNLRLKNSNNTFLPWILNPAKPDLKATRGIDDRNNIEQITLHNPQAGTYYITVDGSLIPMSSQQYVVVYEILKPEIEVTFPMGGESLNPGEEVTIRWDAQGNGNLTIYYSVNKGLKWTKIASDIPSTQEYFNWTVPQTISANAILKVTDGKISGQSKATFYIINEPKNLQASSSAPKSIQLSWEAVSGANSYDVYILNPQDTHMQLLGNTAATSYNFENLIEGATYWMSVRAINTAGAISKRAIAISNDTLSSINVTPTLSTQEGDSTANSIKVYMYPNPTQKDYITLAIEGYEKTKHKVYISIVNQNGILIYTDKISCDITCRKTIVNIDEKFKPGTYIVSVTIDKKLYTERLVIE